MCIISVMWPIHFALCFSLVKSGPLWRALCVSRRESQSKASCNNPGVVQHRSYRSTNCSISIKSTVRVFNFSLPQHHRYKLSLLFHMHSRSQQNVKFVKCVSVLEGSPCNPHANILSRRSVAPKCMLLSSFL